MAIQTFTNQDLADFLFNNYYYNTTQFTVDYTNLFTDNDGTINKPYEKQYEFMNKLSKKDRIVIVVKCRQCVSEDTLVTLESKQKVTIKDIFLNKEKYRKILTINRDYKIDVDKIVDIWQTGIKPVYRLELQNDKELICTSDHKINTLSGFKKLSELKDNDVIVTLNDNLSVSYTYVKHIRYVGNKMTYDLSTLLNESFIANGIHVHNSGFSTAIVAKAFHDAYFGKYPDIVIVSVTKPQAVKVMRRIRQCFMDLPEQFRPDFRVDQAQELVLSNGSRITSLSSNPAGMRGYTGVFLLDEFALHTENNSNEIYEAVYPTTTKGGKIVIVSTPFGLKGMYPLLATKTLEEISGIKGVRDSKKFFVHWKDVPHVNKAVIKDNLFSGLPPEMVDQEYELNFREQIEENQFFSKDLIMGNYIDRDLETKVFFDYSDLGIPLEYLKDLDKRIDKEFCLYELKDKYYKIVGGWDVASTENDSVFIVRGYLRDNPEVSHILGEFYVNRIPSYSNHKEMDKRFESLIMQWKYIKRILDVLCVQKINVDKSGLGRGLSNFIDIDEDKDLVKKVTYTIYNNEWKYQGFNQLKDKIVNKKIKRAYGFNDKKDMECVIQMTNMKLNNVSRQIASKGRLKDDYPNALMLSETLEQKRIIVPKIRLI